jgi:hypothetical protein
MASFNKIQDFVEQLGLAVHNLNTATLKVALVRSTDAPTATDTILANVTQPTGTGYTAGGEDSQNSWAETGGTATLTCTAVTWTATAGDWQSFRYVLLHNDTAANDPLIGWWDYGSDLTLGDGETFTWKPNNSATTGTVLTLT